MTSDRNLESDTKGVKFSQSAGGIVLNSRNEVLVVNQNNNSWSLPKGHLDPGETAREAAEREIYEESGVTQLEFIKELGTYTRPKIGKNGMGDDKKKLKQITLFLYRTQQMDLKPVDPMNPLAKWIKPDEVPHILTHPMDSQKFNEFWHASVVSILMQY